MKPKFLLFIALITLCIRGSAQLDIGSSVVTKSADDATSRVVEIFDVSNTSYAEQNLLGDNWGWGTLPNNAGHITQSDWIAQNLGQVFGIATNTTSPNHLIYVAATQIYAPIADANYEIGGVNNSGYKSFDGTTAGNDNAVLIWALDPVTGAYNALVFSTLNNTSPIGDNHMFNRGTGIGNICYDKNRNRIYATNMEDGGIYTIDASTGNVLSRYYPTFNSYSDAHAMDHFPSFAKRGDLLWGIAYYRDKIYFARWRENIGNIDASNDNEVHSVEINGSGLLDPITEALFSITPIPHIPNTSTTLDPLGDRNYSNPIADIEISLDGQQMLLAERTMGDTHAPSTFTNANGGTPSYPTDIMFWAHKSRVLRYDYNNSTNLWEISNNNYYVGNLGVWNYKSTNCTGGVDFNVQTPNTNARYWATGDALEYSPNWFGGNVHQVEYGLAGIPENGNNYYQFVSPNNNDNVENSSIYLHIFTAVAPVNATGLNVKTHPGDVDLFRVSCAVEINATNPICNGELTGTATVEVTDGVAPYTYAWNNAATTASITGLGGGTYTVTLTDAVGCTATATATVTEPAPFVAIVLMHVYDLISCHDACDGIMSASAFNSGVAPFTYQWSQNGVPFGGNTATITNLCAGDYAFTMTDANGCTATSSRILANPDVVIVTPTPIDATCEGNDGGVTLTVTGGGLTLGYNYLWSNDSTDDHLSNVGPGIYTVTATSNNGCTGTATAIVGGPPVIDGNISFDKDTFCIGEVVTVHLYLNGDLYFTTIGDGEADDISSSTGVVNYAWQFTPGPDDLGEHTLCLVIYSSDPETTEDYCSDTVCISAVLISCGCDSLYGKAHLASNELPNMKYEFYNTGLEASFINWYVDDSLVGETLNDDIFNYQFTPGQHVICMEAAYILPGPNGHNICCYDRDCDSIVIDLCDYWKATDYISYTLDANNYHNAVFNYTGNMYPVPTVIWDFGDGQVSVNNGQAISHYYMNNGMGYQACATVIWSLDTTTVNFDSLAICCCVDTICIPVEINPCNAQTFDIILLEEQNQFASFQVASSTRLSAATYSWSVDNNILSSGISTYFGYNNPPNNRFKLCVQADYYTSFPNEPSILCKTQYCEEFNLKTNASYEGGLMRFYPNPTNSLLTVEVIAGENDNAKLELTDNIGRPMIVKEYNNLKEGNNQLYVNLRDLVDGLYLMKVTVNKKVEVVKVIKN